MNVVNRQVELQPGAHQVEASLPGYQTATAPVSVKAGTPPSDVNLTLQSLAQAVRIKTPDLANGEVTVDDKASGKLDSGSLALADLLTGQHVMKVSIPGNENATVTFVTSADTLRISN